MPDCGAVPKKKPYYRDDSDPIAPSVREQINHDVRTALTRIRSKLEPNNYKELEYLAESMHRFEEELIIEKWQLAEKIKKERGDVRKDAAG